MALGKKQPELPKPAPAKMDWPNDAPLADKTYQAPLTKPLLTWLPRHTMGLHPQVSEVPSFYPPALCQEACYESQHPVAAGSGRAAIESEEAGHIAHETSEWGCRVYWRIDVDATAMPLNKESTQCPHEVVLMLSLAAVICKCIVCMREELRTSWCLKRVHF